MQHVAAQAEDIHRDGQRGPTDGRREVRREDRRICRCGIRESPDGRLSRALKGWIVVGCPPHCLPPRDRGVRR